MRNKYHHLMPMGKKDVEKSILSGVSTDICHALISVALYENDYLWGQNIIFQQLTSKDERVVAAAIIGIGHSARIHKKIDVAKVKLIFYELSKNIKFAGLIQDALDDIEMFCSPS